MPHCSKVGARHGCKVGQCCRETTRLWIAVHPDGKYYLSMKFVSIDQETDAVQWGHPIVSPYRIDAEKTIEELVDLSFTVIVQQTCVLYAVCCMLCAVCCVLYAVSCVVYDTLMIHTYFGWISIDVLRVVCV